VILASSNVNTISNCSINGNTGYGVWLNSSNQNQIFTTAINGNGKIGVLIGCHNEGKCTGNMNFSNDSLIAKNGSFCW